MFSSEKNLRSQILYGVKSVDLKGLKNIEYDPAVFNEKFW
jgi:hypothetical protein